MTNTEENFEDTLQSELDDIVNSLDKKTKKVDQNDPFIAKDDDTLEIRKDDLYSEKVVITEKVDSKLIEGFSKLGISYSAAKTVLLSIATIIFIIAGVIYFNAFPVDFDKDAKTPGGFMGKQL